MSIFAFAIAKWDSKSPCSTPLMNTNVVQARAFCRNLRSKMSSIAIERACLKNGASIFALAHCPIESGFDSWKSTGRCSARVYLPSSVFLNEHKTAVIDLWGVHEQLAELFQHPRIRLIPSWQTLRENDYLRYYDLGTNRIGSAARLRYRKSDGLRSRFSRVPRHI